MPMRIYIVHDGKTFYRSQQWDASDSMVVKAARALAKMNVAEGTSDEKWVANFIGKIPRLQQARKQFLRNVRN